MGAPAERWGDTGDYPALRALRAVHARGSALELRALELAMRDLDAENDAAAAAIVAEWYAELAASEPNPRRPRGFFAQRAQDARKAAVRAAAFQKIEEEIRTAEELKHQLPPPELEPAPDSELSKFPPRFHPDWERFEAEPYQPARRRQLPRKGWPKWMKATRRRPELDAAAARDAAHAAEILEEIAEAMRAQGFAEADKVKALEGQTSGALDLKRLVERREELATLLQYWKRVRVAFDRYRMRPYAKGTGPRLELLEAPALPAELEPEELGDPATWGALEAPTAEELEAGERMLGGMNPRTSGALARWRAGEPPALRLVRNPDDAGELFERWHGFEPDGVTELPVPPLDNVRMVFLGTLTRIDYDSPKWSKRRPGRRKVRGYWHRSTGRPFVLSNPDGNVLVIFDPSGGLRVTADGIKG